MAVVANGVTPYNTKGPYPDGLNEEQGAQWLEIQAVVGTMDEYVDAMDG